MKLENAEMEEYKFHGIAKKMRLVSNALCYGPAPKEGEEKEQHLTINSKGRIWLSSYGYNKDFKLEKLRSEQFKISIEQANYILAAVGVAFSRITMPVWLLLM